MSDPVSSADVVFDFDAANTLITKCRSAATQVTDLSADRAPDVSTAKTDFSGYFSRVFSDNADMETTDAANLSTCLQAVADDVQFLVDTATEENRQRQRARDWDARRAEKWAVEKAVDDLLNIDQRPTSSNGAPPPQEPEAPVLQARANPSAGSTSSGGNILGAPGQPEDLRHQLPDQERRAHHHPGRPQGRGQRLPGRLRLGLAGRDERVERLPVLPGRQRQ